MNSYVEKKEHSLSNINVLVVTAMFLALTYVFTAFVNIRLPFGGNGGLIHLGNIPLFVCAMVFGKKAGAISGGVGMALFDLVGGWTAWAPFTLVIVATMGYVVGAITEKKRNYGWKVGAILAALVIKIVGYYITEVVLYGNWATPVLSIPGNMLQVGTAGILVLLIIPALEKVAKRG